MNIWAVWMTDDRSDPPVLEGLYACQASAEKAAVDVSWFEPAKIEEMEVRD
jgi:hypothetical protein